ncbi:MAG: hypothetical protein N4A47_06000 [Clostridia bacterium]|jgi:hypothetical protein|nr:hypothetical protein [Clostridia bacterium]
MGNEYVNKFNKLKLKNDNIAKSAGQELFNFISYGAICYMGLFFLGQDIAGYLPHAVIAVSGTNVVNSLAEYSICSAKMNDCKKEKEELFNEFAFEVYRSSGGLEVKEDEFDKIMSLKDKENPAKYLEDELGDIGKSA